MLKISANRYITIGQYLQQITENLKKAGKNDPPAIGSKGLFYFYKKRVITWDYLHPLPC